MSTDTDRAEAGGLPPDAGGRREYPRPQLVRNRWASLDGVWQFSSGPVGDRRLLGEVPFEQTVIVPLPPESPESGAEVRPDDGVFWYRRLVGAAELEEAGLGGQGDVVHLRFGAVDYAADVYVDGHLLAHHRGGQTPFHVELPPLEGEHFELALRVQDDPSDVEQARGKQDWRPEQHSIWYRRTSGIWQTAWLESVPVQHIESLTWVPRVPEAEILLELRLGARPAAEVEVTARIEYQGELLAEHRVRALEQNVRLTLSLPRQWNGQQYEELLWSPETPRLLDAIVSLDTAAGPLDEVESYLGLRSVAVADGVFLLNDRPYYLRAVLDQGYWDESHLASPDPDSLRRDVQLIKDLGFNAARMHQKAEDPRFLAWADRLGLLIWGENASAYAFSSRALRMQTTEWLEIVERDRSHPSVVTWVVFNESWGVQHGAHDRAQRDYVAGLTALTRALDPTRPVISNDGWEHGDSDILSIHDYDSDGDGLRTRYASSASVAALLEGIGPGGRRMSLSEMDPRGRPVMLTEFGGISYPGEGREAPSGGWGYTVASNEEDYGTRLEALFDAVHASPVLAGFCYTQLADTGLEINGLVDATRTPKLPIARLRAMVTGRHSS